MSISPFIGLEMHIVWRVTDDKVYLSKQSISNLHRVKFTWLQEVCILYNLGSLHSIHPQWAPNVPLEPQFPRASTPLDLYEGGLSNFWRQSRGNEPLTLSLSGYCSQKGDARPLITSENPPFSYHSYGIFNWAPLWNIAVIKTCQYWTNPYLIEQRWDSSADLPTCCMQHYRRNRHYSRGYICNRVCQRIKH